MFADAFLLVRVPAILCFCSALSGCAVFDASPRASATGYHAVTSSLKDPPGSYAAMPETPPVLRPVRRASPSPPPPVQVRDTETAGCGTADQCAAMLKRMVETPDRRWIGERPQPSAYTDGTRLFAYRALRPRLSCSELGLALEDTRAAARFLASPVPGIKPEQITRARALSVDVEGELQAEHANRCDVGSQPRHSS